ncbi:MAG: cyclic nucleotide-binding domain-containing protein [Pseudomonadota bacterium]|nr:cyclic nucleotide-binding domain-containing protein [Pseudomonadota bacterium]
MQLMEWAALASAEFSSYVLAVLSSPLKMLAALAAAIGVGLIVAGSLVRTMLPLRWLAAGSGVAMVVYGALQPSLLTLLVEAALLPISLYRAIEVTRLTRRVMSAEADSELAGLWLKPYMTARKLKPGQELFCKGDAADALYLLLNGDMELEDIHQPLEVGRIFGEIGVFSRERKRTHTARCLTHCHVLEIHERTVKQLYFQHPAFGFHLIELLVGRLGADIARSEAVVAQLQRP